MSDENVRPECPIFTIARAIKVGDALIVRCKEAQCAWWDKTNECCTFLSLTKHMSWLSDTVACIERRIPNG